MKIYGNPQPIGGKHVTDSSPLDDRAAVQYQEDLFKEATWEGLQYSGMLVAVVGETGENRHKNGLYFLTRAGHFTEQCWDRKKNNYNSEGLGWWKVAFAVMDTSTENEQELPGSFGGNGTPESPFYVASVNGGEFPSN